MKLDDLDKKIENLITSVEKRFAEIDKMIEERLSGRPKSDSTEAKHRVKKHRDASFWGIALVVIGFILLGNHFHWFNLDIPVLPTALIILGCYLILENR